MNTNNMNLFKKKKICVTHDGTFHTDDLFATAVLDVLNNGNIKVIRTRDPKIILKGDYVYDVGGEYNPENDKFDHHQKGGAGSRENGIAYSSLGLIWQKYGEKICGSKEVFLELDRKIVQPIDAIDNGIDLARPIFDGVSFYGAEQVFLSYIPTWKEGRADIDNIFREQVKEVSKLIKREIKVALVNLEAKRIILDAYNEASDKRVIYLNDSFPRYLYQKTLSSLVEPLYVIMPSGDGKTWKAEAITKSPDTMESRKQFPESWRGFTDGDEKFKEVSGVSDAIFCHRGGFLMGAVSKDGIVELVKKALIA